MIRTIALISTAITVLIFTIGNTNQVTVYFLVWSMTLPLAIVIGTTLLTGYLVGIIHITPSFIKKYADARTSKYDIITIKEERDVLARRIVALEKELRDASDHVQTRD